MCLQPTRRKAEWRVGLALAGRGGGGEGAFASCLTYIHTYINFIKVSGVFSYG